MVFFVFARHQSWSVLVFYIFFRWVWSLGLEIIVPVKAQTWNVCCKVSLYIICEDRLEHAVKIICSCSSVNLLTPKGELSSLY